jgi:valyl-tRNA synthetase
MTRVEEYRNFCNKLWNAARYVLMNVEGQDTRPEGAELSLADRWIRSRLAVMLARVESGFAEYRFDAVANALYEFTWHEFCDWYLELSKAVLQSDAAGSAARRGTRHTLIHTLEVLLRALHPLAPFISEEIWQRVRTSAGVSGDSIMQCAYPSAASIAADAGAEPEMRWVIGFIEGVRQIRGELDIPPGRKLPVLLQNVNQSDTEYLERNLHYLVRLAGIEPPGVLEQQAAPLQAVPVQAAPLQAVPVQAAPLQAVPISAVALLGTLEILVPMAGLIDPAAELDRLAKRQRKTNAELLRMEGKLSNAEFARNAPPEVVAKDQQRLSELRTEIGQLTAQIARVTKLKDR